MKTHVQNDKRKGGTAEFFSIRQLAKLLQLSETTIYRMLKKGTGLRPHASGSKNGATRGLL
jgi:excisionase family DNA binding protein